MEGEFFFLKEGVGASKINRRSNGKMGEAETIFTIVKS